LAKIARDHGKWINVWTVDEKSRCDAAYRTAWAA